MEAILKVSRVMRNKPVILSTRLRLQAEKKVFDKTEFSTLTDFQLGSTLCLALRCSEFHFGFPFDPPKNHKRKPGAASSVKKRRETNLSDNSL